MIGQKYRSPQFQLSWSLRWFFIFINIVLGIIPGLVLFFAWIEQNCLVPISIRSWFKLPWVSLFDSSLIFKCLWDFGLFILFGIIHSLLAQKPMQERLRVIIPSQLIRTFYICVTGITLSGLMLFWQPTGVSVWELKENQEFFRLLSTTFYWICMASAGYLLTQFGVFEFLGFKQIGLKNSEIHRTEGMNQLVIKGMYRWVRHPVYSLTLLAFLATPQMNLDRLLVFLATLLYLVFAIPLEEKKLVQQFGCEYDHYRSQVPALLPINLFSPYKGKLESLPPK